LYSGVIHPDITAMVNHTAKLPVEEALYSSALDFTVLQPPVFMQGIAERNWHEMANNGRLSLPYSVSSNLCWVDYRDVAEVAAMAMTGDELTLARTLSVRPRDHGECPGLFAIPVAHRVSGQPTHEPASAVDG
jgi:uncharacterized protein YbjT (DUF2867 family)